MKKKSIDLKSLWDRAAKTRKVELASTSIREQVAVTSVVGSAGQPQELVPSIVLETNESQVHNESIPSVEEQQHNREPEVASNDPNTTTTAVGEQQQQHRAVELTEPSTWSPIRDGDDSGDESSDEAIYDIDLLSHKLGDQYLNDCLVTFIEREFFLQVKDKDIINRFQAMKDRRFKGTL